MCIAISINDVNIIRYLKAEKRKQGGHFLFLHIDTSYIVARMFIYIAPEGNIIGLCTSSRFSGPSNFSTRVSENGNAVPI